MIGDVSKTDPRRVNVRSLAQPQATHFRAASCEEVGCPDYLNGWETVIPVGREDLEHTIKQSGRHWSKREVRDGGLVAFTFPPGQPCFRASHHKVQTGAPPLHIKRQPDGSRIHQEPDRWFDEHNEEIYRLNQARKAG